MKQTEWEKRFDKKFVNNQSQPKLSDWTITTNHARYVWDIKAFIKQEIKRVIGEVIKLSDDIEMGSDTSLEEWKAFKHLRNTLRDKYEIKAQQRREAGLG